MKQRAVLIALVLVCLMTMFALVEVRGWEGSEKKPERASEPPGCFDIKVHPVTARNTFLVNKCNGDTWLLVRAADESLGWEPMRKY